GRSKSYAAASTALSTIFDEPLSQAVPTKHSPRAPLSRRKAGLVCRGARRAIAPASRALGPTVASRFEPCVCLVCRGAHAAEARYVGRTRSQAFRRMRVKGALARQS